MSSEDTFRSTKMCKMEEKFLLIQKTPTEFIGRYPLEPFREDARGTYGGEFVAQSLRAAWDSIEDREFDIHSLHSYFLKAGLKDSVMRYEVTTLSLGRSFSSKLVKCYQLHNDQLCFTLMASFTRNNNIQQRKLEFSKLPEKEMRHPRTKVPFEFLRSPHYTFHKYVDKLQSMPFMEHTNGNLSHIFVPETWSAPEDEMEKDPGARKFGLFFKVNDNVASAHDVEKAKMVDFAFASDSLYLSTVMRAVLPKLDYKKGNFFRVSLDHTVYYHDTNFDPTEWMYLDYKFERLSNDRVLVTSRYFTTDERLVAIALQEALCFFPLELIENNKLGSYKL
ncbi:Thioesterase/thiol ester dehydrase-isomerase [Metschnikowia bicuspidata var. bicuspidata NRRL YB-4993]|uniref:Thioesterase/thiol ester dehydrase-isomerase n=1 Tax=Metschnikowia bicuspidata var. bicuspidata NRRL YB-4993 TaxID=869754 RepID=A0A1A0HFW2_9ASCO|nr:Thioesterase/thiol ester dehydrase-isomerase [Metschnikowia bicuspidata var. bicuspidata NRRL YB-4993]OBA22891.1 Thioesterase/thiol ester dehydrase-isomerase [Metschnikowia bicuspidata var. bicuspidata NRRL YB-4993]